MKIKNLSTTKLIKTITNDQQQLLNEANKNNDEIATAVDACYQALKNNGKIIYIGTFVPERISTLDCLPIIDKNIIKIITSNIKIKSPITDLKKYKLTSKDVVIGLSWSGTTEYTIAGLEYANEKNANTIAITSDSNSPLAEEGNILIALKLDPEIITNKINSHNAYKYILNIISTSLNIKTNNEWLNSSKKPDSKIEANSIKLLAHLTSIPDNEAKALFKESDQNLSVAIIMYYFKIKKSNAIDLLSHYNNSLYATLKDKDNKLTHSQKISGQKAIIVLDTTNSYIKLSYLNFASKAIKSFAKSRAKLAQKKQNIKLNISNKNKKPKSTIKRKKLRLK